MTKSTRLLPFRLASTAVAALLTAAIFVLGQTPAPTFALEGDTAEELTPDAATDPATDLELPSIPGAAESASTGGTKRFNDVHQGHKFYTPITWMYNEGLTTGVKGSHGVTNYLPGQQLTREAMAAFMYRQAGSPEFQLPSTGFVDIAKGHKFYKPIMWMKATGLTGGVKTPNGLAYKPGSTLSREAMAAFGSDVGLVDSCSLVPRDELGG